MIPIPRTTNNPPNASKLIFSMSMLAAKFLALAISFVQVCWLKYSSLKLSISPLTFNSKMAKEKSLVNGEFLQDHMQLD